MQHDILLIGTYHKTGTVWMEQVFMHLCRRLAIAFTGTNLRREPIEPTPGIYLDDHSAFPESLLNAAYVGFRMIRDPRDVIISGAHYHARANEAWLHEIRTDGSGKSYQQILCSFDNLTDKLLFEMNNTAKATCREMVADMGRLADFLTVHYETWMTDISMEHFAATLGKLGFQADEIEVAQQTFFEFSMFGKGRDIGDHARSGKVEQWRSVFTRPLAEAFLKVNGDALITLGYEKNHDWVLNLSAT